MKIIKRVTFNEGEAYVFDRLPSLNKYKSLTVDGERYIYAYKNGFMNSFYFQHPEGRFKAFAGREFILNIDGADTLCNGQWWDGGQSTIAEYLGLQFKLVTLSTVDQLRDCYVFHSRCIESSVLDFLLSKAPRDLIDCSDYRVVLNEDRLFNRYWYAERAKRNAIKQAKHWKSLVAI